MHRRPRLFRSADALVANYARLRDRALPANCAASIKANAYGVGIEFAAPVLAEAGCETFFVAHAHEGVALRKLLPDAEIFVFHGLGDDAVELFRFHRLQPVLNSLEDLQRAAGHRLNPAIHFDTGMHRLGLPVEASEPVNRWMDREPCALVMSHLASADDPADKTADAQRVAFQKIISQLNHPIRASLANTAGTLRSDAFHFDLVRPGIGLYGGSPDPNYPENFQSVVHWHAPVLQLAELAAGVSVGYGGQFTTTRRTHVATLATGYADGYLRCLGDRAAVSVDGVRCPLIGRVSMDLLTVDVTDFIRAGGVLREGSWCELMGDTVTLDEIARQAGTIGYELLTRLGSRFELPAG